MSRRPVTLPVSRPVSLAVAALCVAAVSACGTGQHATTYKELGRMDGAIADVGGSDGVHVRNLHVEGPVSGSEIAAGGTALVTGGLGTAGPDADALVGATTDAAATATLTVGGAPVTSVPIPARSTAPADWGVQLTGLTAPLRAASYIEITLVFQRAGRITLQVPVHAGADNGLGERTPEQDPYEVGGGEQRAKSEG